MKTQDFYFSIILISSILVGLIFANRFMLLAPFTTIFLMIILFLSALKIYPREIVNSINETRYQVIILIATIFILVILPIVVFLVTNLIYPILAPAFFILSLAPTGMTNPFLVDLMKGDKGLSLILVICTSLLAPLTIPFLINFILGDIVNFDFIGMFVSLTKIIFIPFVFAWIVKHFFSKKINQISDKFNNISTIFLGLLLATVVATYSEIIIETLLGREGIFYLIATLLFFIFTYIISFVFFYKVKKTERFTIIVCSVIMNFVLMVVIANQFFYKYDEIVIPIILSVVPWVLSLIVLKQISKIQNM